MTRDEFEANRGSGARSLRYGVCGGVDYERFMCGEVPHTRGWTLHNRTSHPWVIFLSIKCGNEVLGGGIRGRTEGFDFRPPLAAAATSKVKLGGVCVPKELVIHVRKLIYRLSLSLMRSGGMFLLV